METMQFLITRSLPVISSDSDTFSFNLATKTKSVVFKVLPAWVYFSKHDFHGRKSQKEGDSIFHNIVNVQ